LISHGLTKGTRCTTIYTSKTTVITKAANKWFARMENEVQQALTVMDKQTGQILNYRQLLRGPKY
jgi:membrane carboxypeptidase/penicillin-binding protein